MTASTINVSGAGLTLQTTPFWWEDAPLETVAPEPVAAAVDVAIVGAGYTGLSAAITLARAGRVVAVFDRQRPGEGASTRNGGITSGNLRHSLPVMTKRLGEARARDIVAESKVAREDLYRFLVEDDIDCDFRLTGRFVGAMTCAEYDALARDADNLRTTFGIDAHAVPKSEQHRFIGTDLYHGGNVRMDVGGLHPAKLHREMLRLTRTSGATVHGQTRVERIEPSATGFTVTTDRGTVSAADVITATNGYSDEADRWLQRRLVPVRSRMIATADLGAEEMDRLVPQRMMLSDTRKLSYYFRPSPDGQRILFGGRDGTIEGEAEWPTTALARQLALIFPSLANVELTHSWYGHVAMNRDMVPRIFRRDGIRYAAGYCGSGVVWARWAGQKVAQLILAEDAGKSSLDFRPPAAVPFFRGKAWFMPGFFAYWSRQDAATLRRSMREAEGRD